MRKIEIIKEQMHNIFWFYHKIDINLEKIKIVWELSIIYDFFHFLFFFKLKKYMRPVGNEPPTLSLLSLLV